MADGPVVAVMTSAGTVSHVGRSAVDMGGSIPQQGPGLDWQVYAMGLWLLGVMGVGGFLVVRLRSLVTGAGRGSDEHCVPQSFYNQMVHCADRLGLRRLPRVVPTHRLSSPAVFGLVRPLLLMPVGYLSRLSRKDAEHVLLHELAHVKRGDLWMHGLVLLLQVVYWYNPLLWLVRRRVHQLRELCCDATVAGLLREDTPAYRQTLVETARRFLAARSEPGLGLLGLFEDTHLLLARLNWLERPTWRYRRMKRAFVVTLMALMLACVLPMAQAQPQHKLVPEHAVTVPHQDSEPVASLAAPAGQSSDSFEQQMDRLRQQMEQLQQQMQQLAKQREQLAKQQEQLAKQMAERIHAAGVSTPHVPGASPEGAVVPHVSVSVPGVPHVPAGPIPHTSSYKVETSVEGKYAVKAIKPQTLLKIENGVGSITIRGVDQPDCTIKTVIKAGAATKDRADEMAGQVKIRVTPEDGAVRVGADIPDDLRNNKEGEGIQISFELTVPRHVSVQAAQQVGDIRLSSLAGEVKATTNVGGIHASGLEAGASLVTNVGDIHLTLPPDASVKVNAKVEVGAIRTDVLDVTGASELKAGGVKVALGSSATGTLGDGRHRVYLKSQVGQIRIQSETSSASRPQL